MSIQYIIVYFSNVQFGFVMNAQLKERVLSMFTQESIAKKLRCRQQTVSLWLNKGVPDGKVLLFSKALNWMVTPHEIRPDMYPGFCDGLPDAIRHELRRNKRKPQNEA